MEPTPATRPRRRRRARSGRRKTVGLVILAIVVIVVALIAWVGVRAAIARAELEALIPLAGTMQSQVAAGDGDAARLTGEELSARAATAAGLTSDPVWRAFETVPAVGPNLTVVRQLASAIDALAHDGIRPLARIAGQISVDDFRPVDGAIDVQPFRDAQPAVAQALNAMRAAQTDVAGINIDGTIDPIADAVERLASAVDSAEPALESLDKAVRVVPAMLGADGPRNYLVLVQNPAELRSTGGIMGAVALVHTENGAIQLTQQASGASFPRFPEPVLELPADTQNLYGAITGQYMLNVGLTPNFPLSATLAKEMWRLQYGLEVDGVLSIDPVALGYVLAATGPIALPSGESLTSDNAVTLLLTEVYERFDVPKEQDEFFASAAAAVFSGVAGGDADPIALIGALAKAGDERRVLVWSAAESEQAVLADTTLAGRLPLSDAETQRFGLYLNDATGAKMDTYLDVSTSVGQVTCRNDGRPSFSVQATLTNTAPMDAATVLPGYVTGGRTVGVTAGSVRTIISAYADGQLQNAGMTRDLQAVPYFPTTDDGYQVSSYTLELAPGERTVLRYEWLGDVPFDGDLELETTPVIHKNETNKLDMTC